MTLRHVVTLLALAGVLAPAPPPARARQTPARPDVGTNVGLDGVRAKNFEVRTLKGRRVRLAELLGVGRPVVLDFWATWCGPCRVEIPHLIEIAGRYRDRGLVVVGLTVEDPKKDVEAVKRFAKQFGMTYEVAFAPPGMFHFFNGDDPRDLLPQTFIFAPDGRLIRRLVGYNARLGKEILEEAVERAVSAEAGAGR